MVTFIYDTATYDNIPIAVCGFCDEEAKDEISSALNEIKEIEFGNYKSAFTIDYRLSEIIKKILLPFKDSIGYIGASVGIENAESPTGGVFGNIFDENISADENIVLRTNFISGTKPGFMAFAANTQNKVINDLFEKAETKEDFITLYNTLIDSNCSFIMISDGSGKGACGIAATDEDIVFLSETLTRAKEKREYFGIKRIGIMGGTFDPVHNGHLIAAETVREALKLEKVIFIPTGNTSYKRGRTSNGVHRYKMTSLAVETNKAFEVSSIETENRRISYTVDTIEKIRKHCDDDADIYFIMGADVLEDIACWKGFDRLVEMCSFAAVTRPGYNGYGFKAIVMLKELGADISFIEVPALDISSSGIRRAIREGRSVKYLMPEKVEKFIKLHRLYTDKSKSDNIDSILRKLI